MGYQVYLQKFELGDAASLSAADLFPILEKYGEIVTGPFGLEFHCAVGNIADQVRLTGAVDTGITGVTFDRPTTDAKLPELVYELLSLPNTCFFGADIAFVQTRSEMAAHLPVALIAHLQEGLQRVQSPHEVWPLTMVADQTSQ